MRGAKPTTAAIGLATRIAAVCLAAMSLCLPGCGDGDGNAEPAAFPGREGLNVLLISIDTLRADHLGCYGNRGVRTPNIDRFAAEGVRFEQCISSVPLTLPSHATMVTGEDAFVHGARDNGAFVLASENVTLAERFHDAGYQTHAAVASIVLDPRYGLDQGFDTYDAHTGPERTDAKPPATLQERVAHLERPASKMTAIGGDLLAQAAKDGRPFFIFLHYYDPHMPYLAPPEFARQYSDGYSAEIAYTDAQLGVLLDRLHELGLAGNTLVVITSDHGEGLGEHGEPTHGMFLYDATLHVPLMMRYEGLLPAQQVVASQVRLLDVAPTILSLARLMPGESTQGRSLTPLIANPDAAWDAGVYSETIEPAVLHEFSMLRSWRKGGWKYIHSPAPELYHVAVDPSERANLAEDQPERVAAMREELRGYVANAPKSPAADALSTSDEEQTRKLATLGYLSADGGEDRYERFVAGNELDRFEPSGPNPSDHVEQINLYAMGAGAIDAGDFTFAEEKLSEFLQFYPDHPGALRRYADALHALDRTDDAIAALERHIELRPDSCEEYWMLGSMLIDCGRDDRAEQVLIDGLDCRPDDERMRELLAELYGRAQRWTDAAGQYAEAVRLSPDDARLRVRWAAALRAAGKVNEAIVKLQNVLKANPQLVRGWLELSRALEDSGDAAAARQTLEKLLTTQPNAAPAYDALARLLDRTGRRPDALDLMRRAHVRFADDPLIAVGVAWRLATSPIDALRDGEEAVRIAQRANELSGGKNPGVLDTLAVSLAEASRFDEAIATEEQAIELARAAGKDALVATLQNRLEQLREHQPYRDK